MIYIFISIIEKIHIFMLLIRIYFHQTKNIVHGFSIKKIILNIVFMIHQTTKKKSFAKYY